MPYYDSNYVQPNVNYNYNVNKDPYRDRLLERVETISRGNRNLVNLGYHPGIDETSAGEANATVLNGIVNQQGIRPNSQSAGFKGVLGGLVTGGAVGLGTLAGLSRVLPERFAGPAVLGAGALGIGAGIYTGNKIYDWIYDAKKKEEDDATVENAHNNLLEHLAQREYRKVGQ